MVQRPNYRLHFHIEYRDDSLNIDHYFYHGGSDDVAIKMASDFIRQQNEREEEEIKSGKSRQYDRGYYEMRSLKRISYVMREVIEETNVPLEERLQSE